MKPAPSGLDPAISYVIAGSGRQDAVSNLVASPVLVGSLDYLVNAVGVT